MIARPTASVVHSAAAPAARAARRLLPAVVGLLLAGCAAQNAYRAGNELVAQDRVEAGLVKYQEALAADPAFAGTCSAAYGLFSGLFLARGLGLRALAVRRGVTAAA